MLTLEQAINRLEDLVSGCYRQRFPKSPLRTNTRESIDLIKFSFMTMLNMSQESVRTTAFENIVDIVLDHTPLPHSWQNNDMVDYIDYAKKKGPDHILFRFPDVVEECIECCDVILKRLENNQEDEAAAAVYELNNKYFHKYLYFRDNAIGSQYVWVKNIHKNKDGNFEVDGTVIFTNGVNNTIGLYDVENHPIEDFHCFGDKENRFTKCRDLDDALQKPMDTRLKNHVITSKEVAEDILFTFTWFYEIHIPELAKILKGIKFNN
jgi:hypothetical protein